MSSFWDRVKPWACPACEMKNINATLTECPRCHEPRVGSTAAPGSKVMTLRERMQPWMCDACGQQNIWYSKADCPKCHTPRAGTAAATLEASVGQTTRIYEGENALQAGIAEMARLGWRVASQSSFQPPAGVGRVLALGWVGAMVVKPTMKFTVIYQRNPTPTA